MDFFQVFWKKLFSFDSALDIMHASIINPL